MEGSASFRFEQKLKFLKDCIVKWKEEFRGLEERKLSCLSQIKALDVKGMSSGLEEEEKGKRREAEREYNQLLKTEEISWRQKSRATWLKEGDRNMKFFHKTESWRKFINQINRLKVQGQWVYNQEKIRDSIEQFYVNLYCNPFPNRPILEEVDWNMLEEQ